MTKWTLRVAMLGAGVLVLNDAALAQSGNGSGIPVRKGEVIYESRGDVEITRSSMTMARGSTTEIVMIDGRNRTVLAPWNITFTTFNLNDYSSIKEPQITWHIKTVDALQASLLRLGASRVQNARAREFIASLRKDYPDPGEVNEIITDEGVGSRSLSPDPEVMRVREAIKKFRAMPAGNAYDVAFMNFQIEHLTNEAKVMRRVEKAAHDDDLEDLIEDRIERLDHRRTEAVNAAAMR